MVGRAELESVGVVTPPLLRIVGVRRAGGADIPGKAESPAFRITSIPLEKGAEPRIAEGVARQVGPVLASAKPGIVEDSLGPSIRTALMPEAASGSFIWPEPPACPVVAWLLQLPGLRHGGGNQPHECRVQGGQNK